MYVYRCACSCMGCIQLEIDASNCMNTYSMLYYRTYVSALVLVKLMTCMYTIACYNINYSASYIYNMAGCMYGS